jgi:glycylpeptide N-tetradecanoyltransferase
VNTDNKLHELIKAALLKAKEEGFDVFNALDIFENATFLEELKFGQGDGNLNYYLYNWNINNRLFPAQIGIVLV